MLEGKKILIGVTGSIAAYKIPLLIRLLVKARAEVKVVVTPCATDFVTPLTLSTLSQRPVLLEPYNKTDGSWHSHVDWGRWADLFLIAPLSANTMAKMVAGIADNLLTTTYLAAKCPVMFAPAMDLDMYHHPTTHRNIETLRSFGNILIAAREGELASGLTGVGRMEEPEEIYQHILNFFSQETPLKDKKVMISAGPTFEAIDPVRYIGNHSSGKMGYALAEYAAQCGAEVMLISGPVQLKAAHAAINTIRVNSAAQMAEACLHTFKTADVAIMSAAVADYTVNKPETRKIKKTSGNLTLELKPTTDILSELGKVKQPNQFLVGFALETDNEIEHARQKMNNKNLDMIVLNSLNDEGAGFGFDTNKVSIIHKNNEKTETGLLNKAQIAAIIINQVIEKIK
ncbi:MAG: bifunctional phosphopantothenoylcysteine decarboxylase/phosphopantothenate--cysteine ligase CoaBC [Lentimicrobiaceae bacterium]|nr:bifunctional phosphopantothenoylcysteine decarboxylase/phosphopantothenate--cysteine ligase CoaBC [Lentimicrobiaceae bacterium]